MKAVLRIAYLAAFIICCANCYAETTQLRILNDGAPRLRNPAEPSEVCSFASFFAKNIAEHYASQGAGGMAFSSLFSSSFFKNSIEFFQKALKDLDLSLITDIKELKSFYINLHNILVLDALFNQEGGPESVTNLIEFERTNAYQIKTINITLAAIKHRFLRDNAADPFDGLKFLGEEEEEEEQRIEQFPKDKRIFAALFFTTTATNPFRGYSSLFLEDELDLAMKIFCEDGVSVKESTLSLNKIFNDYLTDFAPSEEELLKWLSNCVKDVNTRIVLYLARGHRGYVPIHYVTPEWKNLTQWDAKGGDVVIVRIYTESLCPDSRYFFLGQLSDAWQRLKHLMDLEIVIFGKASVTPVNNGEDFEFDCQNGPLECEGNRIMSCVVALLPTDHQVPFLVCLYEMKSTFDYKACSSKLNIPNGAIEECVTTMQGAELLYENGEKTLSLEPGMFFVPTVTFNGVYKSKDLTRSLENFVPYFCELYTRTFGNTLGISTPKGCTTQLDVYLESFNPLTQKFFLAQLYPTWNRLQHALNLRIHPFGNTSLSIVDADAFECQNSPLECYGNIVIGCIVDKLPISAQMRLLHCMFSKRVPPLKGKECAKNEGIPYEDISECIDGPEGSDLFRQSDVRTSSLKPPLKVLPSVTVNGHHNETFTEWAINDLLALVCDTYYMARRHKAQASLPQGCPVRVELYIEMLCTDTQNFFLRNFLPAWDKLNPLIDLHIIPFGKANVWPSEESADYDYEFECQHGPMECQGNKVMSCIVEYLPVSLQVQLISCMIQSVSPSMAGEECAEKYGVSWEPLKNCSSSSEGSILLFQNGVRTMALVPTLFFVPTITINGFYDKSGLQRSLANFDDQLCDTYLQAVNPSNRVLSPRGCRVKLDIFVDPSSRSLKDFVAGQLIPLWKSFQRLLSIRIFVIDKKSPTDDSDREGGAHSLKSTCNKQKIFICVSSIFSTSEIVEYLSCATEQENMSCESIKKCSDTMGMLWSNIFNCAHGTKGVQLLKLNHAIFRQLPSKFRQLPAVALNGYIDAAIQKEAFSDLSKLVCTSFDDLSTSPSEIWRPSGCRVTVEVYLAALCPDSKKFFLRHLVPTWQRLKSILDLKIIPFGKASAKKSPITQTYEFECQNGAAECHGNKLLSCMANYYSTEEQINMISCMLQSIISVSNGIECAEKFKLDWDVISSCMKKESDSLLFSNGQKTNQLKPAIFFVPTVTINNHYNKIQLRKTLKDLSGFICNAYLTMDDYPMDIPDGCKIHVKIFFELIDEGMKNFFAFHLEEFWKYFKDVIILEFLVLPDEMVLLEDQKTNGTECSPDNKQCHQPRLLSCLTKTYKVDTQLEFFACLMSHSDTPEAYIQCSEEWKVDINDLHLCAASMKSTLYLDENKQRFTNFKNASSGYPVVVAEKAVILKHQQLTNYVCKKYKGPRPPKCTEKDT